MDMPRAMYLRALEHVAHYVRHGTQGNELNLAGIGESTLHPDFVEYVALARATVGPHIRLVLATNGILMTDDLARALKPYDPRIWVSLHRPEKAGPAIEVLKRHGLLNGVSADPSLASIDWAGQVAWHVSAAPSPCPWLAEGWVMVMADGRLTTCCLDASGAGVVGHVDDEPGVAQVAPYALCAGCHQTVPADMAVPSTQLTRAVPA
jgi:hypothetical protein